MHAFQAWHSPRKLKAAPPAVPPPPPAAGMAEDSEAAEAPGESPPPPPASALLQAYRTHYKVRVGRLSFCPWCGQAPRDNRWEQGWFQQACRSTVSVTSFKERVLWAAHSMAEADLLMHPQHVLQRLTDMRMAAVTRQTAQAPTASRTRTPNGRAGSTDGAPRGPSGQGGRQHGGGSSSSNAPASALELWYSRASGAAASRRQSVQGALEPLVKRQRVQQQGCMRRVRSS